MICPRCKYEWKDPARVLGGKMSKRKLSRAQARAMGQASAAKRLREIEKPETKNTTLADGHAERGSR